MRKVAVLAVHDVIAFDVGIPVEVFGRVRFADGANGYRVQVCGTEPVVSAGPLHIATDHGLEALADADIIIVPGREDVETQTPAAVVTALRAAYSAGATIASICTGAFTLADAGLLDGKRATTHWAAADLFRATHPAVDLDPDVLYVDEGRILTSAGASAGVDLCLYMVRRDHGAAIAATAAKFAVAPLHRSGGQAQFIVRNQLPVSMIGEQTQLNGVLTWIEQNAHRELTLADIAAYAATSIRTLNRRFQTETGQTPMQWVTGVRIRHAQELLEGTSHSIERIGREVGFASAANFREQFRRLSGVAPQTYRNTFKERASDTDQLPGSSLATA
ncbi:MULTISPECIES: GlxA family transcriptional regulator [Mycobacteriaceae]|uniref:AraC family transcriptional regulator n=1 Tax=Mycolicibacterium neoaurum VKM Ac-1815D TaxID=700508 RepID=V5X6D1_MYCNE|nr:MULTISPECIES: helix-turn-helix domain-containing protein [Mycobacteriaceae]AHC23547.1 AraC family transcriptional regulator [Mycolicibacterium neoaurum VKM Ac-1815D]AMO04245.1 AraC family transcriptional regulator [Mycolicibacterium neoaurum]AXK77471.1 AraC family transcriptional regulator [Mycolicibacterium neoaurum]KJQ48689.1 AraC family transcriptional regulator [Mycolicibacterium neoaurum]KUM08736.1 AraC family transcriptional regulator [Mycolicibacterium neoaurum]